MRVYDVLREDLLKDDLIADQPKFSANYMRKVNPIRPDYSSDFVAKRLLCLIQAKI